MPACAIIKHNNPCGCALGGGADEAFRKALACDPMSAFGGVVCFNRKVDRYTAEAVHELFVELIFAPGYDDDALEILQQKKNIRILDNQERRDWPVSEHDIKRVRGGILIQHRDEDMELRDEMQVVTKRKPTEAGVGRAARSRGRSAKHVRSNAIVLAKDLATVGIGAGQMSRVDSVRLAVEKAQQPLDGAAMASDAFFPFPDGPQLGDRRRRAGDHPAGRLTARPRGRRRLRRRGRGDGVHVAAPFPALTSAPGGTRTHNLNG